MSGAPTAGLRIGNDPATGWVTALSLSPAAAHHCCNVPLRRHRTPPFDDQHAAWLGALAGAGAEATRPRRRRARPARHPAVPRRCRTRALGARPPLRHRCHGAERTPNTRRRPRQAGDGGGTRLLEPAASAHRAGGALARPPGARAAARTQAALRIVGRGCDPVRRRGRRRARAGDSAHARVVRRDRCARTEARRAARLRLANRRRRRPRGRGREAHRRARRMADERCARRPAGSP